MKHISFRKLTSVATFAILMLAVTVLVQAQQPEPSKQPQPVPEATPTPTKSTPTETKSPQETPTKPTSMQDTSAQGTATLTATLVDAEKKAAQKAATVEVKTTGINLTDPAKANEMAKAGQGHLHYQVDGGPVIATTTTKLSFHGLSSGPHKIVVMLAGNDHTPLGPQQTLEVTIP
ncbi:MAG TPA: hypothetical protein VJM12_19945 [Pyrinomonadaceae bacterium]|nr:hypothetical protein [Pyrinomonadaceae bacterium]